METRVPEITIVDEPLPVENQDDITAPVAGAADTVTSTVTSSILRGLFARRILVSNVLAGMFYDYNALDWLENWRANFGYLLPVVVIETIWNLMLVVVSVVFMIWSAASKERHVSPLLVWIPVYMLQCVVHVVLLWKEYYRRRNSTDAVPTQISPYRRWEMTNTRISYLWTAIGVYSFPFKILLHDDVPRLFWLTLGFLASSEPFLALLIMTFCSIVGSFFICIGRILCYEGGGGLENDISALPNYIFQLSNSVEQNDGKAGRMIPMETNDPDSSNEIPTDDVGCSICLDLYENGSELKLLPCKHNFHPACIRKWLSIKRICPICKQRAQVISTGLG